MEEFCDNKEKKMYVKELADLGFMKRTKIFVSFLSPLFPDEFKFQTIFLIRTSV